MEAWKDKAEQGALKCPFIFKKSLVINLHSSHFDFCSQTGDKHQSLWCITHYLSGKLTWWDKGWSSCLTLKRNSFLLQMSLIPKYPFKKKVLCAYNVQAQGICDFQTANMRQLLRSLNPLWTLTVFPYKMWQRSIPFCFQILSSRGALVKDNSEVCVFLNIRQYFSWNDAKSCCSSPCSF